MGNDYRVLNHMDIMQADIKINPTAVSWNMTLISAKCVVIALSREAVRGCNLFRYQYEIGV